MILLACAVERELAGIGPHPEVVSLVTGVGPVEASISVTRALAAGKYDLVVGAGIAGALGGAAVIGDGVVVGEDAFELGLEDGRPLALPDGARAIDRARSDPALVAALRSRGVAVLRGITVARVTASEATAQRLAAAGAQVETMEGFAVLRAAERAGVAAIGVRGISNRAGARERSGWDFEAGVSGLRRVLQTIFEVAGTSRAAR
ncbi:MAG TPA: hypothetical protein VJP76_09370 [Candidatus Tumulicola sp.]|nr:hypothetical protein [Candidatus Tumulicola sp.]